MAQTSFIWICCFVFHVEMLLVKGIAWSDMKDANEDLLEVMNYTNLRPVADSADILKVTIDWNLVAINDFDETNGFLELSGYFTVLWNATSYPSVTVLMADTFLYDKIWTPPLMILNSLSYFQEVGREAKARIKYNFKTKECVWQPWVITRSACSPNVKYYPYDKQTCKVIVSLWGYDKSEVSLTASNNEWTFNHFDENGEWELDSTSVASSEMDDVSMMIFTVNLSRRPLYYIINLVSPVLLMGVLNSFVFLLPSASGERIGYSVTCFLSFMILLNMVMEFLPTSSTPMSYLSYYTFVMMVFSGAAVLSTILTISIYHKQGKRKGKKLPRLQLALYNFFTFKWCKKLVESPTTTKVSQLKNGNNSTIEIRSETSSEVDDDEINNVSWETFANFLDWFFFFIFLGGQCFYSISYLVPIFLNY